jgi:hypothetical protein
MPNTKSYDRNYRPRSYWGPQDVKVHFGSRIKGELRRKAAEQQLDLGVAEEGVLKSALDEGERIAAGRVHPRFLGGEFLPDLYPNEVEIARVVLDSTTLDVISIRAKHTKQRLKYSVVNEYDSDFQFSPKSSTRTLTLGQIIDLIEGMSKGGQSASPSAYRDSQDLARAEDIRDMKTFVTVFSQFYPDLQSWFERDAEVWANVRLEELPSRLKKQSDALHKEVVQAQAGSEKNDPVAMLSLGYRHFLGRGVERCVQKAIVLWTEAAELGNSTALFNLAVCFHDGIGVSRNQERALEIYERLAKDGYYVGLKMAAHCRRTGMGCKKNIEQALHWYFEQAKGFGPERFDSDLVGCLRNMNGNSDLEKQAIAWIHSAALLGVAGRNMLNNLSHGKTDEPEKHDAGVGYLGDGELMKLPYLTSA